MHVDPPTPYFFARSPPISWGYLSNGGQTDIAHRARLWLEQARAQLVLRERGPSEDLPADQLEALLTKHLIEGNYRAVISLLPNASLPDAGPLRDIFGWAFIRHAANRYPVSAEPDATGTAYDLFYDMAALYAARGDLEVSLAWLRRRMAVPPRIQPTALENDPHFAQARGHPEFQRIMSALRAESV